MYYLFVRTRRGTVKRQIKRNKTLKIKGTVMEVEKALIVYVFQKYPENFAFELFIIL